ncbi:IucA/IucC family protein [Yinghuangia sp. YIM S09857]|uniref:IucA/IucC family protein n=1 Tax=Yinghuangia sp. YIM S09857 TaxID=3436929 RepID=UPI003F52E021
MSVSGERPEDELCVRILDACLREDIHGLRSRGTLVRRADGLWLTMSSGSRTAELPVRRASFLCDLAARGPALIEDGRRLVGLDALLGFLAAGTGPEDADDAEGFAAFADECRAALATVRLHEHHRGTVFARLAGQPARGIAGSLVYDAVAAYHDHPAYPTGRCRVGLPQRQLLSYAPEFMPRFALRWAVVPRAAATVRGELPPWWPAPAHLGLPDRYDASHLAFPVHPSTDPRAVAAAVPGLRHADEPHLTVAPTLSMRSVVPLDHPEEHLKLPLATSTLGLRNKRTITPGSLADAAAGTHLLGLVLDAEPRFRHRVLIADENTHGHAGHELAGFLLRRHPPGLDGARVVSVAALAAAGPGGRMVVESLADEYFDGDPIALYDAYLSLLLDWNVTLWLRYGIALEAHQQNTSLVLHRDRGGRTRLRLLVKDNDSPRVLPGRARALLGDAADAVPFHDPRIPVADGRPLADLFTTITIHLCAAAPMFALAAAGRAALPGLTALLRARLDAAAVRHADSPDFPLLRERLFAGRPMPVKLMVTAGTLLDKARSGASDINKHYAWTGPDYLAPQAVSVPVVRRPPPAGGAMGGETAQGPSAKELHARCRDRRRPVDPAGPSAGQPAPASPDGRRGDHPHPAELPPP